jgi:hypothetical protein
MLSEIAASPEELAIRPETPASMAELMLIVFFPFDDPGARLLQRA